MAKPMILNETSETPTDFAFDVAIVSIGYERRCRWIVEQSDLRAERGIGLEFGFLAEASYSDNRRFFEGRSYSIIPGLAKNTIGEISKIITACPKATNVRVFVDVSAMSREMIANVVLAIEHARQIVSLDVSVAYAPSKFGGSYTSSPIRRAAPIKTELRGWSNQPSLPLGTIMGLGCEPGMALGALQYLEPQKSWVFWPESIDEEFTKELKNANTHIGDIFDVTSFNYSLAIPNMARGRLEALLNALDGRYRLIIIPFGPKLFAWLSVSTVVFEARQNIGIWAFSSKEHGNPVDRSASGHIVWHSFSLEKLPPAEI